MQNFEISLEENQILHSCLFQNPIVKYRKILNVVNFKPSFCASLNFILCRRGDMYTTKEAITNCKGTLEEDRDKRIKWEVKFPEGDNYVPFKDTEVRIDSKGKVSSSYYRKPQNKGITLNDKSCHLTSTKEAVVSNYYNTDNAVSSGPAERERTLNRYDGLATGEKWLQ